MNHPEIILVLARARNGVIGANGRMPWHLPADLRHFKRMTKDRPMIMGRRTFDSLPGLLPGRRHIVITRDAEWGEDGVEVVHSLEQALKIANAPHVAVIGGAEIFQLALPLADRIELTQIHADYEGDVVVDNFDPEIWEVVAQQDEDGDPAFSFMTLLRRNRDRA